MNINDQTFQKFYSKYYDLVYKKKDYHFECKRIESFFKYKEDVKQLQNWLWNVHTHFLSKGYNIIESTIQMK